MPSRPANVSLIHRRCPGPSAAPGREQTHQPEPDHLTLCSMSVVWPATCAESLARDHAAPASTLALVKATSLACGRSRPLAWCSRPRNRATLPAKPLDGALVGVQHLVPTAVIARASLADLALGLLPAAVLEDDRRAVAVRREGQLDLRGHLVDRSTRMPRHTQSARELVVEHLAPHGLAAVLGPLDETPAVPVLEGDGVAVLQEDPVLVQRPPGGDLLREDAERSF